MTRLQVMICTHRPEGLRRVAQSAPPPVDGVAYIVSCQSLPIEVPPQLRRSDVRVAFTATTGLSNNRNAALSLVTAPYALIADDDVTFYPQGLKAIIQHFDEHPEVDIATYRCDYPRAKIYPPAEHDLSLPYKGYNPSSIEIALRTDAIRRHGLRFSPLLGIGAPYLQAGEEGMLLLRARRQGLTMRFYPISIANHPAPTTGNCPSAGAVRANGAYTRLAYPHTWWLRVPLIAWRTSGNTLSNALHLVQGAAYAMRHKRQLLCT